MVWKLAILLGASLVAVFPVFLKAQDMSAHNIFRTAALAKPNYALGVSYAHGQNAPVVMTEGPTIKGGSVAVADNARWHIGSISKSFTSTLVMRLVDRGRLDLDAPVERYLAAYDDDIHPDWKVVTLRQLLSHTAGLPANASRQLTAETYEYEPHQGRRAVLSAMWGVPLDGETDGFLYSNIGYVLAGLIVEEVLGMSWEEAIRSEISIPLGLSSLGFGAPTQADAAQGHRSVLGFKSPVSPQNPASDNPRWMEPAGAIHLSMADLAKWGQAHIEACEGRMPRFLSRESCQAMQTPVSSDYGLGWVIQQTDAAGPIVWHNGSNTMWYAVLSIARDSGLVVAVATNVQAQGRMDQLTKDLIAALVNRE